MKFLGVYFRILTASIPFIIKNHRINANNCIKIIKLNINIAIIINEKEIKIKIIYLYCTLSASIKLITIKSGTISIIKSNIKK